MGYNDEEKILDALAKANGVVNQALEILLASQDQDWYLKDFFLLQNKYLLINSVKLVLNYLIIFLLIYLKL